MDVPGSHCWAEFNGGVVCCYSCEMVVPTRQYQRPTLAQNQVTTTGGGHRDRSRNSGVVRGMHMHAGGEGIIP